MAALLYLIAAAATLLGARRIAPLSRGAAIALLLLPLLGTGRALATGGVYAPLDLAFLAPPLAPLAGAAGVSHVANPGLSDVSAQFLPWKAAVRFAIAHREWPLWNPFELCGSPLAAAVQSAPYHPVSVLGYLLPLAQAVTFEASMFALLAALSMFLFLRELVESELAALFGAAAWMLSTHLVLFAGTAHGSATSILPLVLLGARRIARHPGRGSTTLLTFALVLLILAGHPESVLHVVALAVAYFAFELAAARGGWPSISAGFAAGIAALLLTAVFLLPLFEALPQTGEYRYRRTHDIVRGAGGRALAHRLLVNFAPFIDGGVRGEAAVHDQTTQHGWLGIAYAGALCFPLALFALIGGRGRERWFFGAALLFGLLAGTGARGAMELLAHLPGFSIAVNDRMISFATASLAVLAAIGIDTARREKRALLAGLCAACAAFVALAAAQAGSGLSPDFVRLSAARELLPLLFGAAVLLVFRAPRAVAIALFALLLIERTAERAELYPTYPARAFFPVWPGLTSLPRDGEVFRVAATGNLLTPNEATLYELEDVRGYQAMTFGPLAETFPAWSVPQPVWSNRVDDLSAPFVSLMNVRFALVPAGAAIPPGWRAYAGADGSTIVENLHALPRAFVPAKVYGAKKTLGAVSACRDFKREAWLDANVPAAGIPNGAGVITTRRDGTRLRLHASMAADAWVVISEPAWRGWQALEGGHHRKLVRADHAFLALRLTRGEHDLLLAYRPRSFILGGAISIAAAIVCAVFLARSRK
jgi:hypothetical protein